MNVLRFSGRTSLVPAARLKDSNLDGTVDDGYFALSYAGAVEARWHQDPPLSPSRAATR